MPQNKPEAEAQAVPGHVALDRPVRPAEWALFAPNGNYRIWSTVREEVERVAAEAGAPVTPLYVLAAEDVKAVNSVRCARAWSARDTRCCCDHNEYCAKCWPVEFRPGGVWDEA